MQIKASVAGITGRAFGSYVHGLFSGSKDWWEVMAPA